MITGDADDPVLARVVSLTERPSGIKVHLELLPDGFGRDTVATTD